MTRVVEIPSSFDDRSFEQFATSLGSGLLSGGAQRAVALT